ncbi:MAG: FixG Ig-like domain-containing protein [Candidatus Woesearchaeota archaeon]
MAVMVLTSLLAIGAVSAQQVPLSIDWVKVNGDRFDGTQEFERGEELDIRVSVEALADVEDVQIEAYISGYRYGDYERELVSDTSKIFDLRNGSHDKANLDLEVPLKIETEDTKLRIRVSNRNDESFEETYQLDLVGVDKSEALRIKDFTVSPSSNVEAGRALSFKVRAKNYGDRDLDDAYLKVSIPSLGIADDETLDEIEVDETETFEELLLRIPKCTEPGTYTARATLEFDEYEEISETMEITVLEGGVCETDEEPAKDKTVVTVPESQEVVMGTTGGVYPVMISNLGSTAKTYTLSASGAGEWGKVRFDPASVVVVEPESVKTVYMYVSAKEDAQAGSQVFKLDVESDSDSKEVVLSANLQEGAQQDYDGLRRGLEIGLIVLVIVLIILGLIIGFNKLKGKRHDEDEESQTYY